MSRNNWVKDLKAEYDIAMKEQLAPEADLAVSHDVAISKDERKAVKQAVSESMGIINNHKKTSGDVLKGVKLIQDEINALLLKIGGKRKGMHPDDLKIISMAQKQNSHSLINAIQSQRKSHDLDVGGGVQDGMPDAISITFYRDSQPQKLTPSKDDA